MSPILHYENNKSRVVDLVDSDLPEFQVKQYTDPNCFWLYNEKEKWGTDTFILSKNSKFYVEIKLSLVKNSESLIVPRFEIYRKKVYDQTIADSTTKGDKEARVNIGKEEAENFWKIIACLSKLQEIDTTNFQQHKIVNTSETLLVRGKEAEYVKELIRRGFTETIWREIASENSDIIAKLANSKIQNDRVNAIKEFKQHLDQLDWSEDDWDRYFSTNPWIFGLGLNYRFLRTEKTQANLGGHDVISGKGDRITDTLLTSVGDNRFTVLVEIKKPDTALIGSNYRGEKVPLFSEELYGGINQIISDTKFWEIEGSQTTSNRDSLEIKNNIYTISPKGILIIGRIKEFEKDGHKRRMFQNFRQNHSNIEILTYDELYARALYMVSGEIQSNNEYTNSNVVGVSEHNEIIKQYIWDSVR